MANPIPTKSVKSASVQRRVRGELAGGQKFKGMITLPFIGSGEQLVENMYIDTGKYLKMTGNSERKDLSISNPIGSVFEFQKEDETFQTLVTYFDGTQYKLRAIEEDGTVTIPNTTIPTITGTADFTQNSTTVTGSGTAFTTELKVGDWITASGGDGVKYRVAQINSNTNLTLAKAYGGTTVTGAGITFNAGLDPNFTTGTFYYRFLGGVGYIANGDIVYCWNGTDLLQIQDDFGEIIGLLVDGRRLVVIEKNRAIFSQNNPSQNLKFYNESAGVNNSGEYKTSLVVKGGTEAGAGIIIFGLYGAESHWVRENDASNDVSSDTKIQEFRYTGRGITDHNKVTSGRDYIYFLNELGIHRMNPFTGETRNLMDDAGKILRYFNTLSRTNATLLFSPKEKAVVMSTTNGDSTNDRLLVFYEDNQSFSFKTRVYANCLGVVNNQLYSGEANGKLVTVFDDTTYTDQNGETYVARIITEWDSISSVHELKTYLRGSFHFSLSPESNGLTTNLYFDGDETIIDSKNYTTIDATDTSSVIGEGGSYTFAIGSPDASNNSQNVKRRRWVNSFTTYALELREESSEPLEINSLIDSISSYGTEQYDIVFADKLFALST